MNGEQTLYPCNTTASIGQRNELSKWDIERVRLLYDCVQPVNAFTEQEIHQTLRIDPYG